jgi:Aspartyl protease
MLRVSLVGKQSQKKISASALLDSGAEGIIINTTFAQKNKLTLRTLKHPLPVKNVDSSSNKAGPIRFTTIQTIRIDTPDKQFHKEHSKFYVTAVGTHDLILGTDWLKAHNPELDWTTSRLAFTRCPPSCKLSSRSITVLSYRSATPAMVISQIEPFSDIPDHLTFTANAAPYFVLQHELSKYYKPTPVKLRAKTTHSTTLANEANKNPALQQILAQFQIYESVFSEQASGHLPQH